MARRGAGQLRGRANWIRPEDLPRYEKLGYTNFKIVERNTPTSILALRLKAYAGRRYDGNLLDLVQNYAYPKAAFTKKDEDYFSLKRLAKYFLKPSEVNLLRFSEVMKFGKLLSMLYPREAENPVQVDNRALDGFLDRFEAGQGCEALDCETCRYCHEWAQKAVHIEPEWRRKMSHSFDDLLGQLHDGSMWETYRSSLWRLLRGAWGKGAATREVGTGGEAMPKLAQREAQREARLAGAPAAKDCSNGCGDCAEHVHPAALPPRPRPPAQPS